MCIVCLQDFDEDGWPELLVTTDYGDSKVFWNNGDGTFVDCTEKCNLGRRIVSLLCKWYVCMCVVWTRQWYRFTVESNDWHA